VYDVSTGTVYGPSSNSPYYQDVTSSVSSFNDIAEPGRFYHNPDNGVTAWRSSFDNQTYVIGGGQAGAQGVQGIQGIQGSTGPTGGINSRTNISGSVSLSSGQTGDLNITGYKGYCVYAITTSAAAWVRLYVNSASRTADASRNEFTDPDPDAGVIVEVITSGSETILISPAVFGYNIENPVTTNVPIAVTNKSGSSATITVILTLVQLEV
jgi:hypothetical protein